VVRKLPDTRQEEGDMKYLFAWLIGVPGILVFIWFCMAHC
jgi:hypothetical protein